MRSDTDVFRRSVISATLALLVPTACRFSATTDRTSPSIASSCRVSRGSSTARVPLTCSKLPIVLFSAWWFCSTSMRIWALVASRFSISRDSGVAGPSPVMLPVNGPVMPTMESATSLSLAIASSKPGGVTPGRVASAGSIGASLGPGTSSTYLSPSSPRFEMRA